MSGIVSWLKDSIYTAVTKSNPLPVQFTRDVMTLDGGALNISQDKTIFDYKPLNGLDSPLVEKTTGGGGSCAFDSAIGGFKLRVTGNNQFAILRQRVANNYTSGNPISLKITGIDFSPVANSIKQIGIGSRGTVSPYNTSYDGFYFETDNTDIWVRVYRLGTLIHECKQSNWNLDKLNGQGTSGITLAPSNFEAFLIDYLYLGGTGCRWGFIIGNNTYWVHEYVNSNVNQKTFVDSPNLNFFWAIYGTGTVDASFTSICCSVSSHGGTLSNGISLSYGNDNGTIVAKDGGVWYALIGVQPLYRNAVIDVSSFDGMGTTGDQFVLGLIYNPSAVAGTFTYNAIAGMNYKIAYGTAGASTNIVTLDANSRFLGRTNVISKGSGIKNVDSLLRAGFSIGGTPDSIVLAVMPIGGVNKNLSITGCFDVVQQA